MAEDEDGRTDGTRVTTDLTGVVPLFVADFWDVPLLGICKFEGETLFFQVSSDPETGKPLRYAVFRLPLEQTEFFVREMADFECLVGTFWSYSQEQPFRRIGGWTGRSDWRSFYDLPKRFDLKNELKREAAELVGYFVWPSLNPDVV